VPTDGLQTNGNLEPASPGARPHVLSSLRGYRPGWLKGDLSAGLAIAAVGLPSAVAYPAIAGLPPETGIYASIASVIGYAILGPSKRLIVGPDAATMAVLAGVLATVLESMPANAPQDRAIAAAAIAMCVGLICLGSSLLRLGNLASLLSRPILVGFFVGVAISIIIGQLGRVTGMKIESDGLFPPFIELFSRISEIHWPSLFLATGMFVILQGARKVKFPIPGPVLVVVLATLLSYLFGFDAWGIKTVGQLPAGLPSIGLPWVPGLPIGQIIFGSAAVFVVSFGAGIITARSFGAITKEQVNANAELTGFGAANIASSLMGGFPVTSSDSRTAVNLSVGGHTQLAGLTAAVALGTAILYLGDWLRILPIPALGAILISAALSVIDLNGLRQIWQINRIEFGFAMIALAGALSFGVLQGVLIAILATFVYVILNSIQPRIVLLGRLPGRSGFYKMHRSPEIKAVPGLAICLVQGSLLFLNTDHVKARLLEIVNEQPATTRWLVIDGSAISQLDTTAVEMLEDIRAETERHGIKLGFAEIQSDVALIMKRAHLIDAIGPEMLFDDLEDVLRAFQTTDRARAIDVKTQSPVE
jgi:SulP family sulfate permease